MYQIIKNDVVLKTHSALQWIKRQDNGAVVPARQGEGDAVLVDGTIYAVRGQETGDGLEVVDLVEVQDSMEDPTTSLTAAIERGMTK